jgi:hypothetical protein
VAGVGRGVGSDEGLSEGRCCGIGAGGEEEVEDDPDEDAVLSCRRWSLCGEDEPTKEPARRSGGRSAPGSDERTSSAF